MVVSFSYAYIKYEAEQEGINTVGTNCIKIEMIDITDAITLKDAYPMKDEEGEKLNPYKFKIKNECGIGVDYQIHIRVVEEAEENKMEAKNIAAKVDSEAKEKLIEENKVESESAPEAEEYRISEVTYQLGGYQSRIHEVRIWLDESADNESQNKIFKGRVVIESTQNQISGVYKELLLNGADPVLDKNEELVPVIVDKDKGTVKKADVYEEWYKYENKEWANAIIPTSAAKDTVNSYEVGHEIQESEIESYFVWIPKYSYKLFDMGEYTGLASSVTDKGSSTAIEIRFGTYNTKDLIYYNECATPMNQGGTQGLSGESGACEVGDWMTHPAFLAFGGNGFWVGKFETGYKDANSETFTSGGTTCKLEVNNAEISHIIIKPNSYSWRCITITNMFKASKAYKQELQSHMLKNTEWGAIAYLTQSIYGRCNKQDNVSKCTEVTINGNTAHMTGYTNSDMAYTSGQSKDASTTGNYTGIYDMSGCSWEYVAGVIQEYLNQSELNETDLRYYDSYSITSNITFDKRILGDATGELGPFKEITDVGSSSRRLNGWYNDFAWLPESKAPWFSHGGGYYDESYAGIFAFSRNAGATASHDSFRVALAPTNGEA